MYRITLYPGYVFVDNVDHKRYYNSIQYGNFKTDLNINKLLLNSYYDGETNIVTVEFGSVETKEDFIKVLDTNLSPIAEERRSYV